MVASSNNNASDLDIDLIQQFASDLSDQLDRQSGRPSASGSVDAGSLRPSLPRISISTEDFLLKPVEERLRIIGHKTGRGKDLDAGVEVGCKDLGYFVTKACKKHILRDVTCNMRPGSLTLVCGRSGKSSLMKALAGRIDPKLLTGDITYNADKRASIKGGDYLTRNFVGMVGQRDFHLPMLTVRQTLEFACKLRQTDVEHQHASSLLASEIKVEAIAAVLGLTSCLDTIVGDETHRGISGGQRKRVTLAEMIMGSAEVNILDEISTGLDSQTTYEIIKACHMASRIFGSTNIISLLQPSPDVFALFDNIIILDEGRVIYSGTRVQMMPYFASLGYVCPPGKDLGDFCQEVTLDPAAYADIECMVPNQPRTPGEFADHFAQCEIHKDTVVAVDALLKAEDTGAPVQVERRFEDDKTGVEVRQVVTVPEFRFGDTTGADYTQKHRRSMLTEFGIVFQREWIVLKTNRQYVRSRIVSAIMAAFLAGTIFYQIDTTTQLGKMNMLGFFFSAMMSQSLAGLAQIPVDFSQKLVFIKQRDSGFFRPGNYLVAQTAVQAAMNLLCSFIFSAVAYPLAGLSGDISTFLFFVLIIFLLGMAMGMLFKTFVAVISSEEVATFVGITFTITAVLMSGFFITYSNLGWWVWFYYLNPIAYAFTSLTLNSEDLTAPFLSAVGLRDDSAWKWYGVIVLAGFTCVLILVSSIGYAYSSMPTAMGASQVEEGGEDANSGPVTHAHSADPGAVATTVTTGVTLTWKDVCYYVHDPTTNSKQDELQLLDGITGSLMPGKLTALMGTSGAGKTTLLDVLAGRKTTGTITGTICLNGHPVDENFARVVGYCEQTDLHTETATVREALEFSANLRLPAGLSQAERDVMVADVMSTLELTPIADSLALNLSVEQAKRLSIGVELVADPAILFLDEPTSGLDGHAAGIIIRVLKKIVKSGRGVICTIHQPSVSLFSQFDSLLFLRRGGQTVFCGDLGENCSNLIEYFESTPSCPPRAREQNAADWMLACVGEERLDAKGAVVDHAALYQNSATATFINKQVEEQLTELPHQHEPLKFVTDFSRSWWDQFWIVYRKTTRHFFRLPSYTAVKVIQGLIFALLLSSLCFQKSLDDVDNIRSVAAMIFMGCFMLFVANLNVSSSVVMKSRPVYYREQANKMYYPLVYSIAWAVAEIPYQLGQTLLFAIPFYYMVGLNNSAAAFLWFFATIYLFGSIGTTLGHFFGAALPSQAVSSALSGLFSMFMSMFAGFSISKASIPDPWIFAYYLFPSHYPFELILGTQFDAHKTLIINEPQCVPCGGVAAGVAECRPAGPCTAYGYLYDNVVPGFTYQPLLTLVILLIYLFGLRLFTAVALSCVNHNRR